ncbi:MAG: hypothetical protein AB1531_12240 [Chloroflexota bacterium]
MRKRLLIPLLTLTFLLACALSTQLQPALIKSQWGVDGAFGVRPMSHQCMGLQVSGASIRWLPAAEIRFRVGQFSFNYIVEKEPAPERPYCIGQDIWFGE